jgi:hypothetical protein
MSVPRIDLTRQHSYDLTRDYVSSLPASLVQEIMKKLSLSDLVRFGITSKGMRGMSQVEYHNVMAELNRDHRMKQFVQQYKARLLYNPRIVFDGELPGGGRSRSYGELSRRHLGGQSVLDHTMGNDVTLRLEDFYGNPLRYGYRASRDRLVNTGHISEEGFGVVGVDPVVQLF